jgi:hypothetical protein
LNRKNEKEYATIYEMHITNDMNIKNESKDWSSFLSVI